MLKHVMQAGLVGRHALHADQRTAILNICAFEACALKVTIFNKWAIACFHR